MAMPLKGPTHSNFKNPHGMSVEIQEHGSYVAHPGCFTHRRSYDWKTGGECHFKLVMGTYDAACLSARLPARKNVGWFTVWVPEGDPVIHTITGRPVKVKQGQYQIANPRDFNRPVPLSPTGRYRWTAVTMSPSWVANQASRLGSRMSGLDIEFHRDPYPMFGRMAQALTELQECFDGMSRVGALALVESAADHFTQLLLAFHPNTLRDQAENQNPTRGNPRLEQATDFIHEQYYRSALRIEDIAGTAAVSLRHLTSLFQDRYRRSPSHYLRAYRVQRAVELLQNQPDLTLDGVAEAVGYTNARTLRAAFIAEHRPHPSSFRR